MSSNEKKSEKIKWSAQWEIRFFNLKILRGGGRVTSLQRGLKRKLKKKSTKGWHGVTEMKLATVRLLHCMQGLEKSRKTLIFEKKRRKALFFCAHCTLKAADTSENPLFFKIKMPLHGTNIMTKN